MAGFLHRIRSLAARIPLVARYRAYIERRADQRRREAEEAVKMEEERRRLEHEAALFRQAFGMQPGGCRNCGAIQGCYCTRRERMYGVHY